MFSSILVRFWLPTYFIQTLVLKNFPYSTQTLQYEFSKAAMWRNSWPGRASWPSVSLSLRQITRREVGLLRIFREEEFVKAKMTLKVVTGVKNSLFQFPLICQALGKIQTMLASRQSVYPMESQQNYSKVWIKTSNKWKSNFSYLFLLLVTFLGDILVVNIYCHAEFSIVKGTSLPWGKYTSLTQKKKRFKEHYNSDNFRLHIFKMFGISWAPQWQWL